MYDYMFYSIIRNLIDRQMVYRLDTTRREYNYMYLIYQIIHQNLNTKMKYTDPLIIFYCISTFFKLNI